MTTSLLPRAKQAFEFILEFKAAHDGNSPSIREISNALGISSTSTTCYYLDKLIGVGLIAIEKGNGRGAGRRNSIEVIGGKWTPPAVVESADWVIGGTPIAVDFESHIVK